MAEKKISAAYVGVLVCIALLVLMIGVVLKPSREPESVVSQTDSIQLQQMAFRNELQRQSEQFAERARAALKHVVYIEGYERSGIALGEAGTVITSSRDELPDRVSFRIAPNVPLVQANRAPNGGTPVVELRFAEPQTSIRSAVIRKSELRAGEWLIVVARNRTGQLIFNRGQYSGLTESTCGEAAQTVIETGLPLTESSLGGGIFDLEGQLSGLVIRCGANLRILPASAIPGAIDQNRSDANTVFHRYGMRGAPVEEQARKLLRSTEGLFLTEVALGSPAQVAGLHPGDTITSFDGKQVQAIADINSLQDTTEAKVEFLRMGKRMSTTVHAGALESAPTAESSSGTVTFAEEGPQVLSIASGSAAASAGLKTGDRILAIGPARGVTKEAVARLLARRSGAPVFLTVLRSNREIGFWL